MSESSEGISSATDIARAARRRPSGEPRSWTSLVSGFIGGLIAAVLLVLTLDGAGWLNRGQKALEPRLATLDSLPAQLDEVRGATRANAATATGLEQRLAALDQRFAALDQLPAKLDEAHAAAQTNVAAVGGLEQRLQALENRPAPPPPPAPDLTPLQKQIDAAKAATSSATDELRATLSGLSGASVEQRGRVDKLVDRVDGLAAKQVDLSPVTTALDANAQKLAQQRADLDGYAAKLATLEQSLAAMRKASLSAAASARALVDLDRALATGAPLGSALDELKQATGDDPAGDEILRSLEPLRATGVPTVAQLQRQLGNLLPQAAASDGQQGRGDWLGQAKRNIGGLVELHEAGAPVAAADQAQKGAADALARGDVAAAVAAIEPMAKAGNQPAADWLREARQRLDAETAVERLRNQLATLLDEAH